MIKMSDILKILIKILLNSLKIFQIFNNYYYKIIVKFGVKDFEHIFL